MSNVGAPRHGLIRYGALVVRKDDTNPAGVPRPNVDPISDLEQGAKSMRMLADHLSSLSVKAHWAAREIEDTLRKLKHRGYHGST